RCVAAKPMAGLLADQIELPLKRVAGRLLSSRDDELLHVRFTGLCRWTNIGLFCFCWHQSPADDLLPLAGNDFGDDILALLPLSRVARQEYNAGRELPWRWQRRVQFLLRDALQKLVRQRRENAGAVARVRFATASATMIHVAQHFFGIDENLMAAL